MEVEEGEAVVVVEEEVVVGVAVEGVVVVEEGVKGGEAVARGRAQDWARRGRRRWFGRRGRGRRDGEGGRGWLRLGPRCRSSKCRLSEGSR